MSTEFDVVDYETRAECLTDIPDGVYGSLANAGHQPSCSLYKAN